MSTWVKLVVRGNQQVLRGFLAGFRAAAGRRFMGAVLGSDVPVATESLTEKLQQLLRAGSHHVVLAPSEYAVRLVRALAREGGTVGLAAERQTVIAGGTFTFSAESFNPSEADSLRQQLLTALPEGVELREVRVHEERDPSSQGPELYAPVHHYTFRMTGEAVGQLPGILELHRRASSLDGVRAEPLHLILE